MVGTEPPLDDLHEAGLESRYRIEQAGGELDDEPRTLAQAHWWVQPRWVKIVSFVVGVPSLLYLQQAGLNPFETLLETLSITGLGAVVLLQMFFVFRGYWRMDI